MEITIEGTSVKLSKKGKNVAVGSGSFVGVDQFCKVVSANCLTGMMEEPIPDNCKWIIERGPRSIYILEFKPELRSVLWGEDGYNAEGGDWIFDHDSNAANQEYYTIATPYVVMAVTFYEKRENGKPLVFYRNQPLKSLDDPLFSTNLMNVGSNGSACLKINLNSTTTRTEVLGEVVNGFWSGGFNGHMPNSGWHKYLKNNPDPRLKSIEAWQKASLKDQEFVLGVDWGKSITTPRNIARGLPGFGYMTPSKYLCNMLLKAS